KALFLVCCRTSPPWLDCWRWDGCWKGGSQRPEGRGQGSEVRAQKLAVGGQCPPWWSKKGPSHEQTKVDNPHRGAWVAGGSGSVIGLAETQPTARFAGGQDQSVGGHAAAAGGAAATRAG